MKKKSARSLLTLAFAVYISASTFAAAPTNTFVVASYNVENWLLMTRSGKPNLPKPAEEKAAVFDVLASIRPDVLGVVELGQREQLAELVEGLRQRGLDYPYTEWVQSVDTNRHVTLLSRFPIVEKFSRTDYNYDLAGKPERISRGILDVLVKVNDTYSFRALVVHLKSKVQSDRGDQAQMRLAEAQLLRKHIDGVLAANPDVNLVVMGDYNDTPDSEPMALIFGKGPAKLFDPLPTDSKGGHDTHYWASRGLYSRIDYLLTSPGMAHEYVAGSAKIGDVPNWKDASDHRAVYAEFLAHDVSAVPPAVPATPAASTVPAASAGSAAGGRPNIALFATVAVVFLIVVAIGAIAARKKPASPS